MILWGNSTNFYSYLREKKSYRYSCKPIIRELKILIFPCQFRHTLIIYIMTIPSKAHINMIMETISASRYLNIDSHYLCTVHCMLILKHIINFQKNKRNNFKKVLKFIRFVFTNNLIRKFVTMMYYKL